MLNTTRLAEGKLLLSISNFSLDALIREKAENMKHGC